MTTFLYYRPIIPGDPVTHTSQHLKIIILLYYRSFGKMLIFCWQLVHVARNPGISKDLIFFRHFGILLD